jgi:Protein of unknown function (DUF1761)
MPDVDLVAVAAGTVAAFVLGGAYYAVLGDRLPGGGDPTPPWTLAVEVVRCAVLATVVVGLAVQGGIDEWTGGLALGLALWIGFPLVLWIGAMVHEKVPFGLVAIHGGDWLAKLLVVGVIAAVI